MLPSSMARIELTKSLVDIAEIFVWIVSVRYQLLARRVEPAVAGGAQREERAEDARNHHGVLVTVRNAERVRARAVPRGADSGPLESLMSPTRRPSPYVRNRDASSATSCWRMPTSVAAAQLA